MKGRSVTLLSTTVNKSGDPSLGLFVPPVDMVQLSDLQEDHPAAQYILKKRRFNYRKLGRLYDVRFVQGDPRPLVKNRIFFPLKNRAGQLIGGQCKSYEEGKKPYTISNSKKSWTFFNLLNCNTDTIVIVEGPFDAIRMRNFGAASLGSSLSSRQVDIAKRYKNVILAFDGDLGSKDGRVVDRLKRKVSDLVHSGVNAFYLELPEELDPDDIGFDGMCELIKNQCDIDLKCG